MGRVRSSRLLSSGKRLPVEDSPKLLVPRLTVTSEVVAIGVDPKDPRIGRLREADRTLDLALLSAHLYDPAGVIPRAGDIVRA